MACARPANPLSPGDRRAAGPSRRVCRFGVVVVAAEAGQLGGRRTMLGFGEPRGGGAIRGGDAGNPHGANAELKIIDPSANVYLAVAALLGSALRGIDHGVELPAEVTDNPSEAAQPPPILQTDQATVIKALETSPVAAELLTPR